MKLMHSQKHMLCESKTRQKDWNREQFGKRISLICTYWRELIPLRLKHSIWTSLGTELTSKRISPKRSWMASHQWNWIIYVGKMLRLKWWKKSVCLEDSALWLSFQRETLSHLKGKKFTLLLTLKSLLPSNQELSLLTRSMRGAMILLSPWSKRTL